MAHLSWTSWQVIEPIEGPGSQMCSTKGSGAATGWVGQRWVGTQVSALSFPVSPNQVWSIWVGPSTLQRILARWMGENPQFVCKIRRGVGKMMAAGGGGKGMTFSWGIFEIVFGDTWEDTCILNHDILRKNRTWTWWLRMEETSENNFTLNFRSGWACNSEL